MRTVDQTVSDDWRNRELDASFDGAPAPLTQDQWEREYSEYYDDKALDDVNATFDQVFRAMR